eukprot:3843082-Pyramimonas_sp.AAC.1
MRDAWKPEIVLIDANAKLGHKDGDDSLWPGQKGPNQLADKNGHELHETVANGHLHVVNTYYGDSDDYTYHKDG